MATPEAQSREEELEARLAELEAREEAREEEAAEREAARRRAAMRRAEERRAEEAMRQAAVQRCQLGCLTDQARCRRESGGMGQDALRCHQEWMRCREACER
jgi:hypothetical protein